MKQRLKIFLFVSGIICCSTFPQQVNAQRLVFLFGHLGYNIPVENTFKGNYSYGVGAEAGAGLGWNKTFIIGTVGINYFNGTENNPLGNALVYPVKLGMRQYLVERLLYFHIDAGVENVKYEGTSANTCFSADAGIGATLLGLELQLDIDGFNRPYSSGNSSWIGIKAGYRIGL